MANDIPREEWEQKLQMQIDNCFEYESQKLAFCKLDEWFQDSTEAKLSSIQSCIKDRKMATEFCHTHPSICNLDFPQSCFGSFILNSIYAPQIKPWIDIYGQEQILFLTSELLYKNTSRAMEKIGEFLQLSSFPWDEVTNSTFNIVLSSTMSTQNTAFNSNSQFQMANSVSNYPTLPPAFHAKYSKYFETYNNYLENLLGETLWPIK